MRERLDVPFKLKAVSDDGLFSGYGSVFGVIDSYDEVVVAGAFKDSIAHKTPAMLWQHRSAEPIGIYTSVREDSVGLHVEGKLATKTARGMEAYELLKMGALNGLSIGFNTRDDSFDAVSGIRTLKTIDLWEISLVTFPANEASRIATVKNIEAIASLQDAESFLRDAGGFSRREATVIVSRIKSLRDLSDSDGLGELAALLERNATLFSPKQESHQ